MPRLYPSATDDDFTQEELDAGKTLKGIFKEPVTADHANSKRYFIKDEKPTDDEGYIGDVCFVIGG